MEALSPEDFLNRLSGHREAFWEKMTAERRSYGAEQPLTPEIILRRLQLGVVMERKDSRGHTPRQAAPPGGWQARQCFS